jgi:DNA-binding MarR family transcriptional regulator
MPSNSAPKTIHSVHPQLLLDHQLCFALYSASLAMTKLYKPLLDQLGLTYPQYLVLLCLWEQDHQGVSDIGQRLSLDSGTLTPLLKRLEAQGLVERQRSPADERRVHILLTGHGSALQEKAAAIPACVLQATQCNLGEVQALTEQLKNLRQRLLNAPSSTSHTED